MVAGPREQTSPPLMPPQNEARGCREMQGGSDWGCAVCGGATQRNAGMVVGDRGGRGGAKQHARQIIEAEISRQGSRGGAEGGPARSGKNPEKKLGELAQLARRRMLGAHWQRVDRVYATQGNDARAVDSLGSHPRTTDSHRTEADSSRPEPGPPRQETDFRHALL